MIRSALAVAIGCLVMAAPAAAADLTPVRDHVEVHNPARDNGQNCGFPVLWDIHMSVDRTRWYDDSGRIVHERQHITEDNTVQNLATGKTLRDGPVNFVRRHTYEDGVRVRTVDTGVMVNISGEGEHLVDAGRVVYRVLPDGTWDVQETPGQHPVFEALDGNTFIAAMGAFCGVLD
jgi:hypothetical protein